MRAVFDTDRLLVSAYLEYVHWLEPGAWPPFLWTTFSYSQELSLLSFVKKQTGPLFFSSVVLFQTIYFLFPFYYFLRVNFWKAVVHLLSFAILFSFFVSLCFYRGCQNKFFAVYFHVSLRCFRVLIYTVLASRYTWLIMVSTRRQS